VSNTIELEASAKFGYGGKQFVARITGRNPRFTFERDFICKKSGKRGEYSRALVDEPGLYQTRDIDRKGGADDTFVLVWLDGEVLRRIVVSESEAMALAKVTAEEQAARAVELAIHDHEGAIIDSAAKDPEGIVEVKRAIGGVGPGPVRRADLIAARRAEIARLRGAGPVDRVALEDEARGLRARLMEIEAMLGEGVGS